MNIKMSFEERAKKAIINSICILLEKNPKNNIPKIFKLSKALAKDETTKKILYDIQKSYEELPSVREFMENSLSTINPEICRNIFINIINGNTNNISNNIPLSVILSPKSACNLRCINCICPKNNSQSFNYDSLDTAINTAYKAGVNYIILYGGEPFLIDFTYKIYEKYNDIIFTPITNGTLFTQDNVKKLLRLKNVIPIITLGNLKDEIDSTYGAGTYDMIIKGMNLLNKNGLPFGVSTAVSSDNLSTVTSDNFIDLLIKNGCKFTVYSNSYCSNSEHKKTLLNNERDILADKVRHLRSTKPCFFVDVFNDYKYLEKYTDNSTNNYQSFFFTKMPYNKLTRVPLNQLLSII